MKEHFSEQAQYVEQWLSKLSSLKKHWKIIRTLFNDTTLLFDTYGKALSKTGRAFLTALFKNTSNENKNLANSLKFFGEFSEKLGEDYSKSGLALNFSIMQKFNQLVSDINSCKTWIKESTSMGMKELSQAKIHYFKLKAKLEKQTKEVESMQAAFEKAKSEPGNSYQLGLAQKFKEKLRTSNKDLKTIQSDIETQAELVFEKHEALENTLYTTHSSVLDLEFDSLHILLSSYYAMVAIIKKMIVIRKEYALTRFQNIEESEDFTFDIKIGKEINIFTNEMNKEKFESQAMLIDERTTMIKAFKEFIFSTICLEEDLGKSLENTLGTFKLPSYIAAKNIGKSHWDVYYSAFTEIAKVYQIFAGEIRKLGLEPFSEVLKNQENIKRSIRVSLLNFVEGNDPIYTDRSQRGSYSSRSATNSPNIKEFFNSKSASLSKILGTLSESNEEEKNNLENIKAVFEDLHRLEEDLYNSIDDIADRAEKELGELEIEGEYKDINLYQKRELTDDSIKEIRQMSQISRNASLESEELGTQEEEIEPEGNVITKFGLSPETQIVDSFTCALSQKILLHGRMYLTTSHLCFHSYFNSSTLFGRETLLAIPLSDIIKVEKRQIALIFDTALSITTHSSEILFASFLFRDQALATINNLLKMSPTQTSKRSHILCEFKVETRNHRLQLSKLMRDIKGTPVVNVEQFPMSYVKYDLIQRPIALDVCPQKVFEYFFSDDDNGFLMDYLKTRGEYDMEITKWSPPIQNYYKEGAEEGSWPRISTRKLKFNHKLREKLPFMPDSCGTAEEHTVHLISKTEFVIDTVVDIIGVPYCDYFKAYFKWRIYGEDKSNLEAHYGLVFNKSTIFGGKMEGSGTKEGRMIIQTMWIPMAQKKIGEQLGIKVEMAPLPPINVEESKSKESDWVMYALIGIIVLLCITVIRLWWRIGALESDMLEIQNLIVNKIS
ncbi:unnamed protein product [Blepharisma stoltei]|uniref:VASt domain-containing protein n=1 Tax=Blepharisma stoltei TaxID=1481888 RepID=A0AAU9J3B2_9CILI|nr:unnamed protein product [Blepharisma stoltei]